MLPSPLGKINFPCYARRVIGLRESSMHSVFVVLLGIAGMCFGWFVYSRFIAERIFRLDPEFVTPAHEFNDGVDFVPTNRYVLWGHHFTSVAGAAPIVGPAIAVYWGWAPAVALGGAGHDLFRRRARLRGVVGEQPAQGALHRRAVGIRGGGADAQSSTWWWCSCCCSW